jgi:hypothetical protein
MTCEKVPGAKSGEKRYALSAMVAWNMPFRKRTVGNRLKSYWKKYLTSVSGAVCPEIARENRADLRQETSDFASVLW